MTDQERIPLELTREQITRWRWYVEGQIEALERIAASDRQQDSVRERAKSELAIYTAIAAQLRAGQDAGEGE